jgi:chromosome segregation ATPase
LAKSDQVDAETPSPGQVGRKNGSQQSQAMRKIDSLLARIAGTIHELNARVEQISKLEAELQASGRQLDKMKNSLAKQMAAADDLDPRYAQLEPYYKTLLVQNKALDRAQRAHQERASELLTRVASLQDRLPVLHSQLQVGSIGEEIQSKIASVLPILAMENIDQRRNQLAKIREKLGALSLSLQSRRTMPPPELKSDTETSSVRTEPSKKPATGISKAAAKKSKKTAGKLSVECDLARPSCRKWLFLRKKGLQVKNDTTNESNELTGAGTH